MIGSRLEDTCKRLLQDCEEYLRIVYFDHNPDPTVDSSKANKITKDEFNKIVELATINEISKVSRGNGESQQTICAGISNQSISNESSYVNSLAEAPMVNENDNKMSVKQQHNQNIGFAPQNSATWIFRPLSDHMRRNKSTMVNDTTFEYNSNGNNESKYQYMKAEPMKMNCKPDWDYNNKNYLTGSKLCYYFPKLLVWVTRSYFNGSMIESLADPRQLTMIILKGNGIIQTSFGLLKFIPGDMIQIPQNTPFRIYLNKGINNICEIINYYSKESLILPDKQLNVSDLNQVPFMPSNIFQCKYFYNESNYIPNRGEYVRVEQYDHSYKLYYHNKCLNGFNFDNYCHYGPLLHKVNLIKHYERIGTSIGHKDPNIWLILKHKFDPSFGIAFITGESFIAINNCNEITYPPAYLHLNGVHELGELIRFENKDDDTNKLSYDARESTSGEGQCLIHCAGVGHGGDSVVMKQYLLYALMKYLLQNNIFLKKLFKLNGDINNKLLYTFLKYKDNNGNKKINELIKYIYSINNNEFKWDESKHTKLEDSVYFNIRKAMNILIESNNDKWNNILNKNCLKFEKLGMPFGMGYLLIESRDAPAIPHSNNGKFRNINQVSYGIEVGDVVNQANIFLKKVNLADSKL